MKKLALAFLLVLTLFTTNSPVSANVGEHGIVSKDTARGYVTVYNVGEHG
ncbi:hypothetical protein ABE354_23970 [Brevibacillus laterosporus]